MEKLRVESSILCMPKELRVFVLQQCVSASPYNRQQGGSFYDTLHKSWNYTPDSTIRVSDHWNFTSRGKVHCQTDEKQEDNIMHPNGVWKVGIYNAIKGVYHIISQYPKDFTAITVRDERRENKQFTDPLVINAQRRAYVLADKRAKRRKDRRALKMKRGTLWVSFYVNRWRRSGRRVSHAGYEFIFGKLLYESGCRMIIESASGNRREFRSCEHYKEYDRKPTAKQLQKMVA